MAKQDAISEYNPHYEYIIQKRSHQVRDGPGDTDMDGQSELHLLEGSWTYSDPCPVLMAEWSVVELGGRSIINYTAIPDNGGHFYNDGLHLENFRT